VSTPAGGKEELDRLVSRARTALREWTDSNQHDPSVALVELLAFVGDMLSAHQDLIANEAYLGVARRRPAAVRVEVDGERWRQVCDFHDSGPDDGHFVLTRQDDGETTIQFGDGEHGRRPSAGSGIRVRYRSGNGFTSVLLQEGRVVIDADWNEASRDWVYGIYRATVVENADPMMKRRLRVLIPEVAGDVSSWATACLPPGDTDTVPSVGDAVWVAFESGDPDQPVWLGRLFS
jgi:hypothetical protein